MPPDHPTDAVARALGACLISPNEADANGEPANAVDGMYAIARALHNVAAAIDHHPEPGQRPPGYVPVHCTYCGIWVAWCSPPAPPVPVRCAGCGRSGLDTPTPREETA